MCEKGGKKRERDLMGETDFFYLLPEGCIAAVISFTTPQDACRLASLSKTFKSAADSDAVWDRFLPSDYRDVLARSVNGLSLISSLSKKELFIRLADGHILLDGSTKSFSLERSSGKKCYTLGARELGITWSDTPRYWTWRSTPESRLPEAAELVTVCWFEVRGKMKTCLLSPDTNYAAYFVYKMSEETYGFYHPADVAVKTAGGTETRNVFLDPQEGQNQRYQIVPRRIGMFNRLRSLTGMQPSMQREGDGKLPKQRQDGWLEIEFGEFSTRGDDEDDEVEMSVLDIKGGNWKGGLVLQGIEIRPKALSV